MVTSVVVHEPRTPKRMKILFLLPSAVCRLPYFQVRWQAKPDLVDREKEIDVFGERSNRIEHLYS